MHLYNYVALQKKNNYVFSDCATVSGRIRSPEIRSHSFVTLVVNISNDQMI
jgi:hypothetical protein